MSSDTKTLGEVLKAGTDFLARKNADNPKLICELLAGRLLNCKHLELPLKYSNSLSEKQLEAMRRGIKRAAAGEPIQYIVGETGFMGHTFKSDKRALIPRPETEGLVEHVLECEDLWSRETPAILDMGTGSGCIIISIALAKPNALYMALDASVDAIELALENANALGLGEKGKIAFANEDLSDSIEPETIDAIVANLPYIPTDDYEKLPVHIHDHEPRMALDGGADGLDLIRSLVQDAGIVLKPGGYIFLEIGDQQAEAVTALLQGDGFQDVATRQDLAGKDRIVTARLP